jgi:hypothetical protein
MLFEIITIRVVITIIKGREIIIRMRRTTIIT